MIELGPHIFLFERFLQQSLVAHLQDLPWEPVGPGKYICDKPAGVPPWDIVKNAFLLAGNQMLDTYRVHDRDNQIPMLDIAVLRLLRYDPGASFHSHFDAKILSGILYINDDYEGGQLSYPLQGVTYVPKAGDVIFHPGIFTHPHEAGVVTKGVKYVCTVFWGLVNDPFTNAVIVGGGY